MAAIYDINEVRRNNKLDVDGEPYVVVEVTFRKPGKGTPSTVVRMKHMITGSVMERTYKSGEKLAGADIDERVHAFLERPIEGSWPYLWIDATYVKVREAGRIVSVAVIIAVAVNSDGRREVLGLEPAPAAAPPAPAGGDPEKLFEDLYDRLKRELLLEQEQLGQAFRET